MCVWLGSSRRMVLARFPTLAGLVHSPVLPPGLSLTSSVSCEGFTEQQTSFLEPCGQTRTPVGKTDSAGLITPSLSVCFFNKLTSRLILCSTRCWDVSFNLTLMACACFTLESCFGSFYLFCLSYTHWLQEICLPFLCIFTPSWTAPWSLKEIQDQLLLYIYLFIFMQFYATLCNFYRNINKSK